MTEREVQPPPGECGNREAVGAYVLTCVRAPGHGGHHRTRLGSEWGPGLFFVGVPERELVRERGVDEVLRHNIGEGTS